MNEIRYFNADNSKHESCFGGCDTARDQIETLSRFVDASHLDVQTRVKKICPNDPDKECSAWYGVVTDNPYK